MKQPNSIQSKTSELDSTFYVSLLIKAIDSVLEIIGGIIILLIAPAKINRIAALLTQHQLSEDSHDFIANHILKISHDLSRSGRYFAAFYLLSHGIVKLVIIIALRMQKMWAYPSMIIVLSAFIVYQLYRLSYKFSLGLIVLTVFDVFVIWLTWKEYQKHKLSRRNKMTL